MKTLKYCFVVAAFLLSAASSFMSCMRGGTLESLTVTPAQAIIAQGNSQQFTATAKFTDGTTVSWTSAAEWDIVPTNDSIVSVGNTSGTYGLVTAYTTTTGPVTVSAAAGPVSGSATVFITRTQLIAIEVSPINPTIPIGAVTQFTAQGTYVDGTITDGSTLPFLTPFVTWSSSNTEVATISNTDGSFGLVTAVAAGITTITATDPVTGVYDTTVLIVQ